MAWQSLTSFSRRTKMSKREREEQVEELQPKKQEMHMFHGEEVQGGGVPTKREEDKVGRNDPCPCGSGKKYKKCHGQ